MDMQLGIAFCAWDGRIGIYTMRCKGALYVRYVIHYIRFHYCNITQSMD